MDSGRIALVRSASPAAVRGAATLLFAVTGLALVSACGSNSSNGTQAAPPPPPSSASTGSSGGGGTNVTADETDFHIALSQSSFSPGTYTFQTKNSGKFPHALTISGPGVANQSTPKLQAGQSGNVTVTLQNGTYTFYCPVDGHRAKGMVMQVTVGGAGATTSSSSSGSGSSGGSNPY
jgi:uncharacterized cupredoxin-like copper-binding protein